MMNLLPCTQHLHDLLQSSSFVGPLVVGLIADGTGNIRYAFFFLVCVVWASLPVLSTIDIEKGSIHALITGSQHLVGAALFALNGQ